MSQQANNNEQVVNEAEPVNEAVIALVELTPAQVNAMQMMGKMDELDVVARATFAARVKGDFKRYREAEAKVNAQIYDDSSRRGAKWDITKDVFLKQASERSAQIWAELQ